MFGSSLLRQSTRPEMKRRHNTRGPKVSAQNVWADIEGGPEVTAHMQPFFMLGTGPKYQPMFTQKYVYIISIIYSKSKTHTRLDIVKAIKKIY